MTDNYIPPSQQQQQQPTIQRSYSYGQKQGIPIVYNNDNDNNIIQQQLQYNDNNINNNNNNYISNNVQAQNSNTIPIIQRPPTYIQDINNSNNNTPTNNNNNNNINIQHHHQQQQQYNNINGDSDQQYNNQYNDKSNNNNNKTFNYNNTESHPLNGENNYYDNQRNQDKLLSRDANNNNNSNNNNNRISQDDNGAPQPDTSQLRLPQSSLRLIGMQWAFGAEDMCLPASQSFITDCIVLSIAAASLQFYRIGTLLCDTKNQNILLGNLVAFVTIWSLICCNDLTIAISARTTKMFTPNRHITYLLYSRIILSLLLTALSIEAAYYFASEPAYNCTKPPLYIVDNNNGNNILFALYITTIILSLLKSWLFANFFYFSVRVGRYFVPVDRVRCSRRIYKLVRTFYDRDKHGDPAILESIAELFTEFFNSNDGMKHAVTPSDVLTGFALVEVLQRVRKKQGFQFRQSADYNRWHNSIQDNKTQPAGFNKGSYKSIQQYHQYKQSNNIQQNNTNTEVTEYNANHNNNGTNNNNNNNNNNNTSIDIDDIELNESYHKLPDPNDNAAELASQGIQPALFPQDWQRIAECKHYGKYAFGVYGWLLYWLDHWLCCFTIKTARFTHKSELDNENMIGSGIGTRRHRFCQWSVNAFLITTGLPDTDLLYCHIIGSPVYYVCVDRLKKTLVISIRGSLSISDGIADLDAKLIELDNYGIQGGITHKGLFNYALRAIDDIEDRGIVESFLINNRDYSLRIVGHSLGAAVAPIITLLWKNRWPNHDMRCLAYAPPHLFNIELAESDWMLEHCTSIVYQHDIVPRLSLSALWRLKNQVIYSYQLCNESKFECVDGAMKHDIDRVFVEQYNDKLYNKLVNQPMSDVSDTASKQLHNERTSSGTYTNQAFRMSLRPTYLPGRIYHLLPLKKSIQKGRLVEYRKQVGFIKSILKPLPPKTIVYAAHQDTFREIYVSRRMFLDHLPDVYTFDGVASHPLHSITVDGHKCNGECCTKHPRYL